MPQVQKSQPIVTGRTKKDAVSRQQSAFRQDGGLDYSMECRARRSASRFLVSITTPHATRTGEVTWVLLD